MKNLFYFLSLLFITSCAVSQQPKVLPMVFDSVRVTGELVLKNKTKDTIGFLMNEGGGKTKFIKFRALTDSTFVAGKDTIKIRGAAAASGSVETAVNVGDGNAIYKTKDGNEFKFKTIYSSDNSLLFIPSANELSIVVNPANYVAAQRFVDSMTTIRQIIETINLYRVPGKDSLFLAINGLTISVKDSAGGGGVGGDQFPGYILQDSLTDTGLRIPTSHAVYTAINNAVVSASSSYLVGITQSGLDGSTGLPTNKVYWITNAGKEGQYVYAGTVANQSSDNGGTIIVTADLKQYKRVYDGVINAEWFGVVCDGRYISGNYGTGTNSSPGLQAAINAATPYQRIIIPGPVYLPTRMDTINAKPIFLEFRGNTYQAGNDLIILANLSGPFEQQYVKHSASAYDRMNLPLHNESTYDNNTDPAWETLTATFCKIYNTSQAGVDMNFASGFKVPVQILVDGLGGLHGSQENTVTGWKFTGNNMSASIVLLKGQGYADKNDFIIRRMSGNYSVHLDGIGNWNGSVTYNGAMNSNTFTGLVESTNIGVYATGYNVAPIYKLNFEPGTPTGVFSDTMVYHEYGGPSGKSQCQGAIYAGGFWDMKHIKAPNQLGKYATIGKPIFDESRLVSTRAWTVEDGFMVYAEPSYRTLTKQRRDTAVAHAPNLRFTNPQSYEAVVTTTNRFYNIAQDTLRTVIYNYTLSNGVIYFPLPATSVDRFVTVFNDSASTVAISAVSNFFSLSKGFSMTFWCDGKVWRAMQQTASVSSGGGNISGTTGTTPEKLIVSSNTANTIKESSSSGFIKLASGVVTYNSLINLSSDVQGLLPVTSINTNGSGGSNYYLDGNGNWSIPAGATGPGGGVSSFGPVGSGNNYGASISGSVATLHGFTSSQPGIVTTAPQTFPGLKSFGQTVTFRASTAASGTTAFEIPAGTLPTIPENNKVTATSTHLWVGFGNQWQSITTNTNVQTFTNKVWDGAPIYPYKIDGYTSAPQPVLTTTGQTGGTYWSENHGGFMRFYGSTNSSSGTDFWDIYPYLPNNTSGEVEVIMIGENPANGQTFERHWYQAYNRRNNVLTAKGSVFTTSTVSDFTHADITSMLISSGSWYIRRSSPSEGVSIEWTAYVKIRPTFNLQ